MGPQSDEKSLRRQQANEAIGRQLRKYYNVAKPLSDRLADVVKKIEAAEHLPQTKDGSQPREDF